MTKERLSKQDIDYLKHSADLVSIVSNHVHLQKNGDEYVGRCPFHTEKTGSFYVVPKKGICHCFGCDKTVDAISFLQDIEGLSFQEAVARLQGRSSFDASFKVSPELIAKREAGRAKLEAEEIEKRKRNIAFAKKLWNESVPAIGTLVENYLAFRGLAGVMIPPSIRFNAQCWHKEEARALPAMIGVVSSGNQIVGVHRTYLRADGKGKADVAQAKKMLGDCFGGHLKIDDRAKTLAVAEGIETALTIKKACPWLNVWAALSLNNMHAAVPATVKKLILCVDQDEKDRAKADAVIKQAAELHAKAGRCVQIARPKAGCDFNDMVRV